MWVPHMKLKQWMVAVTFKDHLDSPEQRNLSGSLFFLRKAFAKILDMTEEHWKIYFMFLEVDQIQS